MTSAPVRGLAIAILAALTLSPIFIVRMSAPANYGAHGLTEGFGRGRLDLQGIVSEGSGGRIVLPEAHALLTIRLSGDGPIRLHGRNASRTIFGSAIPVDVSLDLDQGGEVSIESEARIRLHELTIEREDTSWGTKSAAFLTAILALVLAARGPKQALAAVSVLLLVSFALCRGSLSGTFAEIALARLAPAGAILAFLLPLCLALRAARFRSGAAISPLTALAFISSLAITGVQFLLFDQPLPLGDPAAYFQMGGVFADGMARLGSPLNVGPILSDLQPYLALPATGVLYGLLRLLGGLSAIYVAQALAMACAVAALVSISKSELGARAARIALAIALLHPSFAILPGIVQPEPFILAAWTGAAMLALRALRDTFDSRKLLGAGVLFGLGLALHPQGLTFLLIALALCLVPWGLDLARRPALLVTPMLGVFSVLLPVAAAEHFAKPLAYVLDKQYGFFAYTSPHPLGFWLYLDSEGWQGPLRMEETTYQKELIASKGEADGLSSTFWDVASFVTRHPGASAESVLRNLHRLWHQPDNPFAVPFVLPYELQVPLQRALVVLFVLGLPVLLSGRLALLALPFVMLSLTYPAYHVFNKYATPALPLTILGAALVIDRLLRDGARARALILGLGAAALGALLPASLLARLEMPGGAFIALAQGLLWIGLGLGLARAVVEWGLDRRARFLAGLTGVLVLHASSLAASRSDTTRGAWSWSLDRGLEATCHFDPPTGPTPSPAWILIDAQTSDRASLRVEVNGRLLDPPVPTMPAFGLASVRGRRDPLTFRQIFRARVSEDLLASGTLNVRIEGSAAARIFGDIRAAPDRPTLSFGNWPYLSVYRLMHEGQYRLSAPRAPATACLSPALSGRPGLSLVRIPEGQEAEIARPPVKSLEWIF